MPLHEIIHSLAAHHLSCLRDKTTGTAAFRRHAKAVTQLIALEATRDMPLVMRDIKTPLESMQSSYLAKGIVIVSILRAGISMVEPIVELFPDSAVGYVGMERDETSAVASCYYRKLPDLKDKLVLLVDPMLATGGSAVSALQAIEHAGADDIRFLCVIAAPEGVDHLSRHHPDLPIYTASLDRQLNFKKYILPGLGDFGDRLYGTT